MPQPDAAERPVAILTKSSMKPNVALGMNTASGTMLSIIPNIMSQDIVKTIILAVVGAVVSFTVSLVLKRLSKPKRKSGF